jgi:ketosteroid isomerase-like protein
MTSHEEPGRALIMRFWEAAESGDLAALRELVAEDVTMTWPQSGERFRGADNAFAALAAQDTRPEPAGEPRIVGCGDAWMVMLPLRYGEEIHHYVGVFELRGGRIAATTEYFGAPFPAKRARAPFAEPIEPGPG